MKPIYLQQEHTSARPLYLQLYDTIKERILYGEMLCGEKLPSLRGLARDLGISVTTTELAYNQLFVEGYITSKPKAGYFVARIAPIAAGTQETVQRGEETRRADGVEARERHADRPVWKQRGHAKGQKEEMAGKPDADAKAFGAATAAGRASTAASFAGSGTAGSSAGAQAAGVYDISDFTFESSPYRTDPSCFDFVKWKKCAARVFNEYSELLLYESDPQGEAALRFEISKYLYHSRGVTTSPDRIVIGAGTQQITGHLCRILRKMDIRLVALEAPGYLPVQSMFRDGGFTISHIPVAKDGIEIDKLPTNIASAVYVSPSNQFPTGAVMPVGRRYELIDWAVSNQSIVIEDDYDSELRYFGKPVPALQGLDRHDRVVYLGTFSSTLFPAIKISYMVLPESMAEIFREIKNEYTQTCSKAEQLTLAFFMEDGYYYTGIRKLRGLYAQKLNAVLQAFAAYGGGIAAPLNTHSGINLTVKVRSKKKADRLCAEAKSIGLQLIPLSEITDQETSALSFYYSQLPLGEIDGLIAELIRRWKS